MRLPGLLLCLALPGAVAAQSSPSFRLSDSVFEAGGRSDVVHVLESTGLRMSVAGVGAGLSAAPLAGPSYSMVTGTAASYPPPGEVLGVAAAADKSTFTWAPDRSVGVYEVYRGPIEGLPGGYGACRLAGVTGTSAVLSETPDLGNGELGFFYLVTAKSRLGEEGTKGTGSAGRTRANRFPCP